MLQRSEKYLAMTARLIFKSEIPIHRFRMSTSSYPPYLVKRCQRPLDARCLHHVPRVVVHHSLDPRGELHRPRRFGKDPIHSRPEEDSGVARDETSHSVGDHAGVACC